MIHYFNDLLGLKHLLVICIQLFIQLNHLLDLKHWLVIFIQLLIKWNDLLVNKNDANI